jgi:hypothetical protein
MSDNSATRAGNITKFQIFQSKNNAQSVDMSAGTVNLSYYESVLTNNISATATIVETGFQANTEGVAINAPGVIDGLPIRGGEQTILEFTDNQPQPNKLSFKGDTSFYVNRVRNIDPGQQKDTYFIDFVPKEFVSNEQTRVVKRYDGQVSDSVGNILKNVLKIDNSRIEVDQTERKYNFIGNDRKPFYVCTWLASKSIPKVDETKSIGAAAGYFFYQTADGFKFKALDNLLDQKRGYKKYSYTGAPGVPEGYDGTIKKYNIERDIDLQQNLTLGTYSNSSIFFDFYAMKYERKDYNIDEQEDGIKIAATDIRYVSDEFRTAPSRLMSHILDVGSLPSGRSSEEQLKEWKNNPTNPTFDAKNTMVQSIMRYNQLFTIKVNVIIPGNFSLRAGDLIYCEFPKLEGNNVSEVNPQSGGIYMIASLCHRITPSDCFTSLSLVRDSYGRTPFK